MKNLKRWKICNVNFDPECCIAGMEGWEDLFGEGGMGGEGVEHRWAKSNGRYKYALKVMSLK